MNDKNYKDLVEGTGADQSQIFIDKLQSSKIILYSRGSIPYLFSSGEKQGPILPSMYLLYHLCPTNQSSKFFVPL